MFMFDGSEKMKIERMINNLKKDDEQIDYLIESLKARAKILLIGGAIRAALNDTNEVRDVDIIVNFDSDESLEDLFIKNSLKFSKNRFGGYKVIFYKTVFDIWTIENHWAFKSNFFEKSVENIYKTTLLNYDSLVYDYRDKKLYKELYRKCIEERVIDLIGSEEYILKNPTPEINILRMLKIAKETRYDISTKSLRYVNDFYYSINSYNKVKSILKNAHIKHYGYSMDSELERFIYNYFEEEILSN